MTGLHVWIAASFGALSLVQGQFQITSVNGRPVQPSGGSSGESSFQITNVNGSPVNGGQQLLDTNRIRVEVQLVRFENPQSLMYNNKFCDTASKCDPLFTADLDTRTPLATWPGPKPFSSFEKVFEISNTDVFDIGRSIIRDVCANTNLANLRVQVQDIDDVTNPDLIDEYECIFDIRSVAPDFSRAIWTSVAECKSLHHPTPPLVRLFYRHREYAMARDPLMTC
ncbi:uncharacterized protein LOC129595581 [Paramacrobiotus metropolitanus]|uniref:uncharacterized protein LOC129595581 n=1 Tax=Paramacrobiotus metropolitanus TaxID=2943436 RepID=UPI0024462405|nr:uncharacterized protein LOC129595581 [Paramacrobiotus metropolitanus]